MPSATCVRPLKLALTLAVCLVVACESAPARQPVGGAGGGDPRAGNAGAGQGGRGGDGGRGGSSGAAGKSTAGTGGSAGASSPPTGGAAGTSVDAGTTHPTDGGMIRTDAATDASPAPWSQWQPTALGASLVLWLDGDRGVEKDGASPPLVTSWTDQSMHHHKAVIGQQMPDHAWVDCLAPHLHAGVANGHDAIGFAPRDYHNTCLRVPDSQALHFGKEDFTVAVVFQHTTPLLGPNDFNSDGRGHGQLFGKEKGGFVYYGPRLIANSEDGKRSVLVSRQQKETDNDVVTPDEGYNDGKLRIVVWRRAMDGTKSRYELRVDGASKASKSVQAWDFSNITDDVYIGNDWHGTEGLTGDIAEIVVVDGAMTSGDLGKLEGYLRAKYGR